VAGSPDPATGPTAGRQGKRGDLRSCERRGPGDPRRTQPWV